MTRLMKLCQLVFITVLLCVNYGFSQDAGKAQPVDLLQLSQGLGLLPSDFVTVSIAGNPRITSDFSAQPITNQVQLVLIEFSDLNCGYCIRFHKNTLPSMLSAFVETGQIDYVYKDYVSIGGEPSRNSALALRCLHEEVGEDIYFDVLAKFYASPGRHGLERLFNIMTNDLVNTQLLSEARISNIRECIQTQKYFETLNLETIQAESIGVVGTPVFVIGVETKQGVVQGILLPGYLHYETLEEQLQNFQTALQ